MQYRIYIIDVDPLFFHFLQAVVNDFSQHLDEDDDDEQDFFTGESDNDFVSLSSGSNSRRAPRKSWTCEHCTYVNNPGVTVSNAFLCMHAYLHTN